MKKVAYRFIVSSLAIFLSITISTTSLATPLQDYVQKKDEIFGWKVVNSHSTGEFTTHYLEFKSQVWQETQWIHRLNVIEPKPPYSFKYPFLFITGSGKGEEEIQALGQMAVALKTPIAILHDVPNQPLFDGLKEDAIIALTFAKFFETGDPTWPLLFPMTKAAIRAMDVLEAFAAERTGEKDLGFFVFGGSKRGWTTWLAAAADTRVKAIAPLVYDNLDLASQMKHHVTAWGDYSYKIKDYTKLDLPAMLSTDKGKDLIQLVDPYAYLDTITIPKLIVMGTNDPYWPLDALNIYYSDLKGSNYIYYVPNAGHDLGKRYDAVIRPITALYLSTTGLINMPVLTWKANETGEGLEMRISGQPAPFKVDFWVAHSPTRDFRPAKWESFQGSSEDGEFIYKLPRPKDGWSAIYAEAHYQLLGKTFSICSQVFLISK